MRVVLALISLGALALGHGDAHDEVDPNSSYAEMHMASEHHMDNFDIQSFFHLHDLNRDGVLDVNELESIYGVHHEKRRKESGSVEVHTEKAQEIVATVLAALDSNGDGVLTMREFVAGGVNGLPNFKGVEHLGHHYDAEGEYFLHHEEQFHSTPETQNEEDYVHPEDIEHFMDHAHIEEVEEERVREFTGEPAEEEPADDPHMSRRAKEDAAAARLAFQADVQAARVAAAQNVFPSSDEVARQARAEYAKAQAVKFGKASAEAKARGAWGSEEGGFARPRDAADRLRANIPRKFKLKSSSWWGDF